MALMALTIHEYAFADPAQSWAVGLEEREHGMLFCVDEDGKRWTAVTDDADYVRLIRAACEVDLPANTDLELPLDKFPIRREGWPDDW